MTNCFPQQFVLSGQLPGGQLTAKRTLFWLMVFIIIGPILAILFLFINIEKPVPEACKDDRGHPVVPIRGEGSWAIILNFNHPESTEKTIGCFAVVETTLPEKKVVYNSGVPCYLQHYDNNVENHVAVGDGKAPFDGSFHIECPSRNFDTDPDIRYGTFFVHSRVRFPDEEANYTIFDHQDIRINVDFERQEAEDNWRATLVSTYGSTTFTDTQSIAAIPDGQFGFQSAILDGEGTHHINREPISPRREVAPFAFDYSEQFIIGGPDARWTLFNMIIDPPDPDSGCC